MKVGVAKESAPGETRVAVVPDTARRLAGDGVEVLVEQGAGDRATFADAAYEQAGARIVDARGLYTEADVVCRVSPPSEAETDRLRDGQVLVGLLQPLAAPEAMHALAARGVTAFSLDSIPRVTRAQPMDALSSQSTVAGYKAVVLAAEHLGKFFPMLDDRRRDDPAREGARARRRRRRAAGDRHGPPPRRGGVRLRRAPRREGAGGEPRRDLPRARCRGRRGRRRLRGRPRRGRARA